MLLGAPGIATRSKNAGAPGIATRSKDAIRGGWPYHQERGHCWGLLASLLGARTLLGAPGLTTRNKNATRGSWHRY